MTIKNGKGIEDRVQTKGGINRRERRERGREGTIVKGDEGKGREKRMKRESEGGSECESERIDLMDGWRIDGLPKQDERRPALGGKTVPKVSLWSRTCKVIFFFLFSS
jgi:hypothetical protein